MVLPDPTVSREHAGLVLTHHGWRVVNLTEQNLVRVNGRRVPAGTSVSIAPQDILVLGNTMLQLVAPPNPHPFLVENEPTMLLEKPGPLEAGSPGDENHARERARALVSPLSLLCPQHLKSRSGARKHLSLFWEQA